MAEGLNDWGWVEPAELARVAADLQPDEPVATADEVAAALEADWSLQRRLDAPTPEQYRRLAPPPTGWEGLADR